MSFWRARASIAHQKSPHAEASGIKEKLQAVYTRRCTEDKWPADVLRCYAGAVGMSAMKLCRGKLPAEQGTKLQAEIMGVMAGGQQMNGTGAMMLLNIAGQEPGSKPTKLLWLIIGQTREVKIPFELTDLPLP